MPNDSITFFCPACGIKLTVPASLAGVVGPCPSCRNQIQAPVPASTPLPQALPSVPPAAAIPVPAPLPQAPIYPAPVPLAMPQAPLYEPPPTPAYPPAAAPETVGQAPAMPRPEPLAVPQPEPAPQAAVGNPPLVKPEPRQLPNRPHSSEVVAKQMPEPLQPGERRRSSSSSVPRHPHRSSLFARFSMLLVFLIMAGALFLGVVKFLKTRPDQGGPPPPSAPANPSPTGEEATHKPAEEDPTPAQAPPPTGNESSAIPTPAPDQTVLLDAPPELPPGIPRKSPGMEALAILEKFLAATTLEERMPLIETKTQEAELASSCLASALPPAPKMLLEFQESNPVEDLVDFYYNVDFQMEDGKINPQTILVRTRGGTDPKVVADPFLDLFGGRLAAYAAAPTDKAGVFQVIASAVASCLDPNIPDREKKYTLKLLPRDNSKEIALAYFSKMSKIHEMLEDGTYSLSYGKAKSCTVMLRWNTEDNAEYPYLEAIALKALDWNP